MTAISTAVPPHSASLGGVPLLRGLRSGGRAFVREVSAAVPALQRGAVSRGRMTGSSRVMGAAAPREAAGRSRSAPAAVRLTRRGRLLLIGVPTMVGVLAAAALLIVLVAPSHVVAGTAPAEGPGVESVTVQPGQSVWELAQQAEPQRDTRDVVLQIMELNDLDSAQVSTGQRVLVPAA